MTPHLQKPYAVQDLTSRCCVPKTTGYLLIAIGALHTAFGVFGGYPFLADIARDGFVNAVRNDPYRQAIVWFFVTGFLIMTLGQVCLKLDVVPVSLGVSLLVISLVGVALMPTSGFWLVAALAIFSLSVNGRQKTT